MNVFTSFGEMVGSVLGLNVDSKKSDVGNYFKKVQETVQGIKDGLNKIVAKMKEEKNPNAEATESAVKTLVESKLDKIIEGAKIASEAIGDANELIGNVAAGGAGVAAGVSGSEIDNLVKGIKGIVDVVLKGVGKADAGDDKKAEDGSTARTAADSGAGKLFANDNAGANANDAKKVATDASKAVGAVIGVDILQAIVKEGSVAVKLAINNTANNAVADAANAKDATIAGGIALRAIAKNGKFANGNDAANADIVAAVKGAAVSAVTKALDTLTVAIRKTIDLGLKSVKDSMRINFNATPVVSDKDASGAKNQ
ncbi:Vlp protein, gamma subfamily (plasmid) [Borrelia crocidurae str. Achema]|uniref:Variable large protein n=1 Tax=Borrelia crocidurae (strain Achema) TaxID=1155096 RepID=I0FFB8_BORCA|nr:Vlp protein, gamma subfamily [Borrelia crocidurae str. Achema]